MNLSGQIIKQGPVKGCGNILWLILIAVIDVEIPIIKMIYMKYRLIGFVKTVYALVPDRLLAWFYVRIFIVCNIECI